MAAAEVTVLVHINRELGIQISKTLPAGATVAALKEDLAGDDPTGQTRAQDIRLASALPAAARLPLGDGEVITDGLSELELLPPPEEGEPQGGVAGAEAPPACDAGGAAGEGRTFIASHGCPASASSSKSAERSPSRAVDGNPDTRWTSAYEDNQWIAIDLGESYTVSHVEICWERAHAAEYRVEGSADGEDWFSMADAVGREGWVVSQIPRAMKARWVRMFGKTRATSFGFSVYQFLVYTLEEPQRCAVSRERREIVLPSQAVEYRVLQRSLVKRLGQDPGAPGSTVKLRRRVGATVFSTGRTWQGARGGAWVELDPITEKPGWLLVEGPGFGCPGPLLERVEPGEEAPMKLRAEKPVVVKDMDCVEHREFILHRNATAKQAKEWIALLFGLDPAYIIIARPGCNNVYATKSARGLMNDEDSMVGVGFKDGDEVFYTFTGDLDLTYEGKEPTWRGPKPKPKALPGPRAAQLKDGQPAELRDHFALLELPESTPHDGIKRHYRKLALENHPDKHPDNVEAATERFQKIKAAYEAIREKLQF